MKKQLILMLTCVLFAGVVFAQKNDVVNIKGQILTADGKPAPGVGISIKNTAYSCFTSTDGNFIIKSPAGSSILVVNAGIKNESLEIPFEAYADKTLSPISINEKLHQLNEVVVTGQFSPQSVKNSVYNVRSISAEKVRLRGATNIQQILNTEFGFRFSNDLTLGTADVEMMGMTGRNIKILLDGVPVVDRSDARESLNQIDINTVERIEVVEGPISVVYGTDALAGVINIITKKPGLSRFGITAKIQEETAGNEYSALSGKGIHNKNLSATWQHKGWFGMAGFSNNEFGGWNLLPKTAFIADVNAVGNQWKPKDQYLGNVKVGYRNNQLNLWYRLDGMKEDIDTRYGINPNNYIGKLQTYTTHRYNNQLHGEYRFNAKMQITGVAGYTDLQRKTTTVLHDYANNTERPSTDAGEQDLAKFNTFFFRSTFQYNIAQKISVQPGIEYNREGGSGARIKGTPVINDYAFFISAEYKPFSGVNIRPGLRFIKNSVYDAQTVVPSLNTKFALAKDFDLRLAYARGFRAPALRELYYDFFDASHSIMGNENLKAESSNSFDGSLAWAGIKTQDLQFRSLLAGFYNLFFDRIDYGIDSENSTITTLININKYKTAGVSLDNTFIYKTLQVNLGVSYIGRYNKLSADNPGLEVPQFSWTPEFFSTLIYTVPKVNGSVSIFFKHTGARPSYQLQNGDVASAKLVKVGGFNWTDVMFNKNIYKHLTLNAGIKNLFDVTQLNNTGISSGGAHSSGGGSVPYSYGRSYVVGLTFNWNK